MTGKSIKTEELFIDLQQFHILFINSEFQGHGQSVFVCNESGGYISRLIKKWTVPHG